MTERLFYNGSIAVWFVLAVFILWYLLFVVAPYGRHLRKGWGPQVSHRFGWILMEIPSVLVFGYLFIIGDRTTQPVAILFLMMWQFHYIYRTFVFPLLLRGQEPMALIIPVAGVLFNAGNAYINGRWLFHFGPERGLEWLHDPRFLIGFAIFVTGFVIHSTSDRILRNLRAKNEEGAAYRIPYGGLFRWISAPNYFGEMTQWLGFAIATWSIPGLAFFVWTFANLFPRAVANHRWYGRQFPDYPKERRAIVPFVV